MKPLKRIAFFLLWFIGLSIAAIIFSIICGAFVAALGGHETPYTNVFVAITAMGLISLAWDMSKPSSPEN